MYDNELWMMYIVMQDSQRRRAWNNNKMRMMHEDERTMTSGMGTQRMKQKTYYCSMIAG